MAAPLDPALTIYSPANARLLVHAANISYSDTIACAKWAQANGFDGAFDFIDTRGTVPDSDTQGFIAEDDHALLIVFRGTEPKHMADVASDARFKQKPWQGPGKVHEGFLKAFLDAWGPDGAAPTALRRRLTNPGDRKVWIAGHSLGGALAQLCAAQALAVNIPVQALYTFGQPRVGDEEFAEKMNEKLGARCYRLVNDRDIVPRVPLFLSMQFRHYGRLQFFNQTGDRSESASSAEKLVDALDSFRQTLRLDALAGLLGAVVRGLLDPKLTTDPAGALNQLESTLDIKKLASEGGENISDHLMATGYLPLFGEKHA